MPAVCIFTLLRKYMWMHFCISSAWYFYSATMIHKYKWFDMNRTLATSFSALLSACWSKRESMKRNFYWVSWIIMTHQVPNGRGHAVAWVTSRITMPCACLNPMERFEQFHMNIQIDIVYIQAFRLMFVLMSWYCIWFISDI